MCFHEIASSQYVTMWQCSIGQTGKFDQPDEAFNKDAKIPVLVNRGDLFPVEKNLDRLYLCLRNYEYTRPK